MSLNSDPDDSNRKLPTVATQLLKKHIIQRRIENVPFADIARETNFTLKYVRNLYKKALREITRESVEQLIQLESEKLNRLEQISMKIAHTRMPMISGGRPVMEHLLDSAGRPMVDDDGDPRMQPVYDVGPQLAGVSVTLKIMERRAKLFGLDMPSKTSLTDPSGTREASNFAQFYIPHNGREDAEEIEIEKESAA